MKRIMEPIRWQDLGNIFLGAWLFVSPWVLDYFIGMPAAAKNSFRAPNKMPLAALHLLAVRPYCLRRCALPSAFC